MNDQASKRIKYKNCLKKEESKERKEKKKTKDIFLNSEFCKNMRNLSQVTCPVSLVDISVNPRFVVRDDANMKDVRHTP